MKRFAFALALVAMVAGCKKADEQPAQDQMMSDSTQMMADSTHMMADSTKMMGDSAGMMMSDTTKKM